MIKINMNYYHCIVLTLNLLCIYNAIFHNDLDIKLIPKVIQLIVINMFINQYKSIN